MCRILTVTYDPASYTGTWMLPTYRFLCVTYNPTICTGTRMSPTYTLEYYLRSHNLYTHLSLTPIQGAWVHFFHTGVWMTLYSHSLYRRLSVSLLTVLQKGVRRQYHEKVTVTLIPWDTTVFFFQRIRAGPRYVLVRWNRWEIHLAYPLKYYYSFNE